MRYVLCGSCIVKARKTMKFLNRFEFNRFLEKDYDRSVLSWLWLNHIIRLKYRISSPNINRCLCTTKNDKHGKLGDFSCDLTQSFNMQILIYMVHGKEYAIIDHNSENYSQFQSNKIYLFDQHLIWSRLRQHLKLINRMITPKMFVEPLNMHGFTNGLANQTM